MELVAGIAVENVAPVVAVTRQGTILGAELGTEHVNSRAEDMIK